MSKLARIQIVALWVFGISSALHAQNTAAGDTVYVDTISELKAYETPQDQLKASVNGYWEPEDGGGGIFTFVAGDTQDSDGGVIIASDVTGDGRWIRDLSDNILDIRWYGAQSDVEENQSGYILSAFSYFFSRELVGTVFIPEGTFYISQQLGFWEGVSMKGLGMDKSVIINTGRQGYTRNSLFAQTFHYSEDRTLGMELSDLKIDVNMYEVGDWIGAIWIEEHFRDLTIDYVHMTNSGGNIIRLAKNSRISNSIFDNMDGRGLSTGSESAPTMKFRDNEILNNQFIRTAGSPTGPGINLSRADNNVFKGNEVINVNPPGDTYGGIRLPNDSNGNLVEDNYVKNFARGIWILSGSNNNVVRGNTIVDSWSAGLFINSSHVSNTTTGGNTLENNVVRQENPQISHSTDLIRIHEDYDATIVDNVISGNEVAISETYEQNYRAHVESQFPGNSSLEEGLVWLTNGAQLEGRNEVFDNFITHIDTPDPEDEVQATFKVDMADSGVDYEDGVYVTGHLNGWTFSELENIYDEVYAIDIMMLPDSEGAYYYITTNTWDDYMSYRETVPSECADWYGSDRGYEIPDGDVEFGFHWGSCEEIEESTSAEEQMDAPVSFTLKQNYPNPFNPATKIEFEIPEAMHVSLRMYNMLGQEVKTIVDTRLSAGVHNISLDAGALSSGIYIYRMQAGSFMQTRTLTLIK